MINTDRNRLFDAIEPHFDIIRLWFKDNAKHQAEVLKLPPDVHRSIEQYSMLLHEWIQDSEAHYRQVQEFEPDANPETPRMSLREFYEQWKNLPGRE